MVSKIRSKNDIFIDKDDNDISYSIKKTNKGDLFYLFDSGKDYQDRIVIFSTDVNLLHLFKSKVWIVDGTFRSCAKNFYQIYTIIGIFHERALPLCYFCMKRKSVKSYEKGLTFIKDKCKKNPSEVIIDFEQASYLAFKKIFKPTKINGCFFHFSQNIYRFVNINKLSCLYKSNTIFRGDIKMIMAFAFLQTNCL
ncbi:hypothetical protein DMUE_3617 [Dictyocoela muelleri]|nr:hypothetical protein DMUE_3617 [Dictyocoela muelleri]